MSNDKKDYRTGFWLGPLVMLLGLSGLSGEGSVVMRASSVLCVVMGTCNHCSCDPIEDDQ